MEEKNETKKEENEEEMSSMAPHVNEKVKYCLIALIIELIVVSALLVVFGPDVKSQTIDIERCIVSFIKNT